MSRETASRICSAQVIVHLHVAVKELVENALDAGATVIEVRLREYGVNSIEVIDNGSGIREADYEGLAAKHATSKIRRFEDIAEVSSFGFRGEALASLVEISQVFRITTRTADQEVGATLEYDGAGRITSRRPAARPVGTTVTVEGLFQPLPVRRREFERTAKRQYARTLTTLQAYALMALNVRLTVVHIVGGRRTVVLSSTAPKDLRESIACVFGAKFLASVCPITITLPPPDLRHHQQLPLTQSAALPQAETAGEDAAADDDDSPVELGRDPVSQPARCATERTDVSSQAPGSSESSPPVARSLAAFAASSAVTQRTASTTSSRSSDPAPASTSEAVSRARSETEEQAAASSADTSLRRRELRGYVSKASGGIGRETGDRQLFFLNGRPVDLPKLTRVLNETWRQYEMNHKPACILELVLAPGEFDVNVTPDKREVILTDESHMLDAVRDALSTLWEPSRYTIPIGAGGLGAVGRLDRFTASQPLRGLAAVVSTQPSLPPETEAEPVVRADEALEHALAQDTDDDQDEPQVDAEQAAVVQVAERRDTDAASKVPSADVVESNEDDDDDDDIAMHDTAARYQFVEPSRSTSDDSVELDLESLGSDGTLACSLDSIRALRRKRQRSSESEEHVAKRAMTVAEEEQAIRFGGSASVEACAAVTGDAAVRQARVAEDELTRVLNKGAFRRMRVLGQFNLGFIIGQLETDLFILDQHACDEKVRFEYLQQHTKIHEQPLLAPRVLEMPVGEELVVCEHLEVFRANGFALDVDEDAPAGRRLRLRAVPFSKGTRFGEEDVHELATVVADQPGRMARLPKARAMFASRACRSAVMIGRALDPTKMRAIVYGMAELEQPWNCPHGRPTLRHLVDLSQIQRHATDGWDESV